MGHFSIFLPDAVGTMVADEPPEDLFEAGWLFFGTWQTALRMSARVTKKQVNIGGCSLKSEDCLEGGGI